MVALFPPMLRDVGSGVRRLAADRSGATAVATGLAFVVLVGFAGLAVDVGSWEAAKRKLQGAADQMAYSAAIGANGGQSGYTNAAAVAAQFGFGCASVGSVSSGGSLTCSGAHGVTVTVNSPPQSGSYINDSSAWEVVLSQPQSAWFSNVFLSSPPVASARAVGLQQGKNGNVCMLALDTRTSDKHSFFANTSGVVTIGGTCQVADNLLNNNNTDSVDVQTGATVNLYSLYLRTASVCNGGMPCPSTLNVTQPILYNQPAITDPYASRTIPSPHGCSGGTNLTITASTTLNPGSYCGSGGNAAITVNGGSASTTASASVSVGGATVISVASVSGITTGMTASDATHPSAIPSGSTVTAVSSTTKTVTLSATVLGGSGGVTKNDVINFSNSVTVTLNPGVYILNGQGGGNCAGSHSTKPSTCNSGDLDITGGARVTGTGVTIVLTTDSGSGINVGNLNVDDSSSLTITAPTTNVGGYQVSGMAIWQNPVAPNPTASDGKQYVAGSNGVNYITSGASTDITGVVYFPSQGLLYSGGSGGNSCTQILAFGIVFKGATQFNYPSNCTQTAGILPVGGNPTLAE